MTFRRLLAPAMCVVLLAGCSGSLSDSDTLRDLTAKVVSAANAKDPSALRAAVETMRTEVDSQQQSGSLEPNRATVILRALAAVERNAGLLTATPTPTPSPTPSTSPTPSPTPSASPTPSPTPSVSPTPSPTPVVTTPAPTQTITVQPTIGVGNLGESPTAAATP